MKKTYQQVMAEAASWLTLLDESDLVTPATPSQLSQPAADATAAQQNQTQHKPEGEKPAAAPRAEDASGPEGPAATP